MTKTPHLIPALAALVLILTLLIVGDRWAQSTEASFVHALAPLDFNQKLQGSVLTRAAFRAPDLLPLLGSSEIVVPAYEGNYRADEVFRNYPTGFTVFSLGKVGRSDLHYLQTLAALGAEVRGKKVALLVSPPWFFRSKNETTHRRNYAGNFSRLQASELAFNLELGADLKRDIARQMLRYPDTLEKDPLLRFALEQLANNSPLSSVLYYLALPLGQVQNFAGQLQDHAEVLQFIWTQPNLKTPGRRAGTLNWTQLRNRAQALTREHTDNNPLGYDAKAWAQGAAIVDDPDSALNSEQAFVEAVTSSSEWTSYELLLRTLEELGTEPLIISEPMKGVYFDQIGITAQARQLFYDKLEAVTKKYPVQLVDFREYDGDKYFLIDRYSHFSPVGWIMVDQVLETFYRGTPAPPIH